jgi:predicted RNase H-like nuclease (RuvC/YqgF family)
MFESKHNLRMKIIDLEYTIEMLKLDLKFAKKRVEEAEEKLNKTRALETDKARDALIYVEWDNIHVVSIDRRVNEYGVSYTEVGYLGEVSENSLLVRKYKSVVFHCCESIHENLIQDYENWKSLKEYK